jgi:hypothetical protein
MAVKSASTGQFVIPTSPAVGVTCSSGAANTYTTTYVQQLASTAAAIYLIGASGSLSSIAKPAYMHLQIATGSAGAEAIVGQIPGCQYSAIVGTTGTNLIWYTPITIPIPVPTATRIAIKTADSVGAQAHIIQLHAINQANMVDAAAGETIASVTGSVSSVTAAITLPSIPANWITAAGVSSNAIATQATGIASSVSGSVGSVTGAVSSVTAAVTLPSIPANWITAAGVSSNAIATQATGIASSVTAAVTLPSIPANWITAAGVSSNAIATQPTGIASSVTAAVTLPTIPTNWITAAGVSASAFAGKGDWNINKTGYSLSSGQAVGSVTGSVSSVTAAITLPSIPANWITTAGISGNAIGGSVIGPNAFVTQAVASVVGAVSSVTAAVTLPGIPTNWITAAGISSGAITFSSGAAAPTVTQIRTEMDTNSIKLDANVASRMTMFSYSAPDNSSISAIKAKTDQLTFTVPGDLDVNTQSVFNKTLKGSGTQTDPWRPQ